MNHIWLGLSLTYLSHVELNYYPSKISLDKFRGRYNVPDDLSTKISVPSKTKDINVKLFNMITRINEVIFNAIVNANAMAQYVIQIKNGILTNLNVSVKSIVNIKKIIILDFGKKYCW